MKRMITTAAGLGLILVVAGPAAAGDFNFNLGIGVGDHGTRVGLGISSGRPIVQPVAVARPVRTERIWVEPVYETVVERVWVPQVETRYRDVPVLGPCGEVVAYKREAYTVETGFWREVPKRVLVTAGHWTTRPVAVAHRPAPVYRRGSSVTVGAHVGRGGGHHGAIRHQDRHRNTIRHSDRHRNTVRQPAPQLRRSGETVRASARVGQPVAQPRGKFQAGSISRAAHVKKAGTGVGKIR